MSNEQILFSIVSASNSRIQDGKSNGFFPNPLTILESVTERQGCSVRYGVLPFVTILQDGIAIGYLSLANSGKWNVESNDL